MRSRGGKGVAADLRAAETLRRPRALMLLVPLVAMVATVGVLAAVIVPHAVPRGEAEASYRAAAELAPQHDEQLAAAEDDLAAAGSESARLLEAVDAVLAVEAGDRVPASAIEALSAARVDAVAEHDAERSGDASPSVEHSSASTPRAEDLSTEDLHAAAAALVESNRVAETAAASAREQASLLRSRTAALAETVRSFAAAVAEHGAELLAEREDAEDEPRGALQDLLGALLAVEPVELGGLMPVYLERADAVLASSDAVREAERQRQAEQRAAEQRQAADAPAQPRQAEAGVPATGSVHAQLDYLLAHAYDYNVAEWGNYNPMGGDCANFVSQGLLQRGVPMDATWYSRGPNQASTAWVYVPAMDRWLAGKGYTRLGLDQLDRLKLGDVGIFDWDRNGSGNHTMTVSRIEQSASGPVVYFVSHNRDGDYRELRHVIDVQWPGADAWFYSIP